MTKGLDDFPPAARTTSELVMHARGLVLAARDACNALNEALTDEQRGECEHLIGYAHDGLSSAEGYLETVARRIAGDEHWPVPCLPAEDIGSRGSVWECGRCLQLHDAQRGEPTGEAIPEHSPRCPMREERAAAWDAGYNAAREEDPYTRTLNPHR
jgi:hypothetical protein